MNKVKIPYKEAEKLLEEGDVLLFRGTGFISALIKISGQGEYSHVALVTKNNGHTECVETREWFGGRIINLKNYFEDSKKSGVFIDIYRPSPIFSKLEFDFSTQQVLYKQYEFDGKKVTDCLRSLTGMPYSYRRILIILKIKLFKWKILTNLDKITNDLPTDEVIMPVCSTIVSHCFAKHNFDILNNKSNDYTEPSHIALSSNLNYLFTLD